MHTAPTGPTAPKVNRQSRSAKIARVTNIFLLGGIGTKSVCVFVWILCQFTSDSTKRETEMFGKLKMQKQ